MKSNNPVAQRLSNIKPSVIFTIAAKATEMKKNGLDVIDLSIGEPDFDTPTHICDAAIAAIHAGKTHYTPVDGIIELRQAICQKFKVDNHLNYEPNQVVVSTGAKQAIFNTFLALLNLGDEIIIPAPYWVSYPEMALLAEAKPVVIQTTLEQDYKITAEQLEKAITDKTKIFLLNSPSNPTGMVYSKHELEQLGKVLSRHPNILILCDDIYEKIYWGDEPYNNLAMTCPDLINRIIVVNGLSKAYAMTGWRLGYVAGPKEIIAAIKNLQSQSTSNTNSITQYAAIAALNGKQDFIPEMRDTFKARHDLLVRELSAFPCFDIKPAQGAFYLFVRVEKLMKQLGITSDVELCELLLKEVLINTVPGSAFGLPGHLRISYATSTENLNKMIERLKKFLNKYIQA